MLSDILAAPEVKICLFIDGLDECETPDRLVRSLLGIIKASKTKICTSSRQWSVFEGALGDAASLTLQNHTTYDLFTLVYQRLAAADPQLFDESVCEDRLFEGMRRFWECDHNILPGNSTHMKVGLGEAQQLTSQICLKADGNFLYARTVLDVVCERLQTGAQPAELQLYVENMPADVHQDIANLVYSRIPRTFREGEISDTAMAIKTLLELPDSQQDSVVCFWMLRERKCSTSRRLD
jgi:hypothetical protein